MTHNAPASAPTEEDLGRTDPDTPLHFELALLYYKSAENRAQLDYQATTSLAALWKQATKGRCDPATEPGVGFFDFVGKDRRKAWIALGDMTPGAAQEAFVEMLKDKVPGFNEWLQHRLFERAERARRERERLAVERKERERAEAERLARLALQEEARRALERQRLEEERRIALAAQQAAARTATTAATAAAASVGAGAGAAAPSTAPGAAGRPASGPAGAGGGSTDASGAAGAARVAFTKDMSVALFKDLLKGNAEAQLNVGRGEVVRVRVPRKGAGDQRIAWQFASEAFDIGFGLDYESTQSADATHVRPILPVMRCATADSILVCGAHVTDEPGNWLLVFDNSYSILRSKTIYYRIVCGKAPAGSTAAATAAGASSAPARTPAPSAASTPATAASSS